MTTETDAGPNAIELATELTIAWLSNANTRASADDVPAFLATMRDSVLQLIGQPDAARVEEASSGLFTPAVSVRKSLASKEHIISMIDGKPYKTLRRHLGGHGLTAEEYRRRYNLKSDYPMVAEAYSGTRSTAPSNATVPSVPTASIPRTSYSLSVHRWRNSHGAPCRHLFGRKGSSRNGRSRENRAEYGQRVNACVLAANPLSRSECPTIWLMGPAEIKRVKAVLADPTITVEAQQMGVQPSTLYRHIRRGRSSLAKLSQTCLANGDPP